MWGMRPMGDGEGRGLVGCEWVALGVVRIQLARDEVVW